MTQQAMGLARSLIGVGLLMASTAAMAADDRNGAEQIMRGDFAGAERIIVAQEQLFPADPDLMLNLAIVYRHTGRASEARALYLAVLARPDDVMDLPNGTARSAHAIASAALDTMGGQQLTAR